jgi:hypothetical protein
MGRYRGNIARPKGAVLTFEEGVLPVCGGNILGYLATA